MFPPPSEVVRALFGVVMLLRRHPGAEFMFNRTTAGFWRSLFAVILVLPGHIYMIHQDILTTPAAEYGWHAAITDMLIYAIVWLAYPAAMAQVANALGRDDRLLDYLVPYNWMVVPIAYLFVLATAVTATDMLPSRVEIAIIILVYGVSLYVLFDLARRQLAISSRAAFGIVCFDFILSLTIVTLLRSFAGR